jgi:hypothetical protein
MAKRIAQWFTSINIRSELVAAVRTNALLYHYHIMWEESPTYKLITPA